MNSMKELEKTESFEEELHKEFGKLSINDVGGKGDCIDIGNDFLQGLNRNLKDKNNEGRDHENEEYEDADVEDSSGGSNGPSSPTSMSEFFQKNVDKKTNVYSMEALPLNTPWTFWVDRTQRGVSADVFEANLRRIYTVYTVQRFWAVYYNLPQPSSLHNRSSLHMMRDDRKPMWEESYNSKGGTFRVRVQKRDTDKVWREMLLAVIGEQMTEFVSDKDEICGVSVSIRERDDMIFIWNANNEESRYAKVFDCLRLLLPDTNFTSEFYKPHITHAAFEKKKINSPRESVSSSTSNEGLTTIASIATSTSCASAENADAEKPEVQQKDGTEEEK